MRIGKRTIAYSGLVAALGLAVLLPAAHRKADRHVRKFTGGTEAPVGCFSCHGYMSADGFAQRWLEPEYLSPRHLAASPDGRHLYVVAEEAGALLVVSLDEARVTRRIPVGPRPNDIAISPDGLRAYVSVTWADVVVVVDLDAETVVERIATGAGPTGLALGPDARFLYVANTDADDLSVIDLAAGEEHARLLAGNAPYAVALSSDGGTILLGNRLTNPVHYRAPPETEITTISTTRQRVVERNAVRAAHLIEGIAYIPGGPALLTLARPKNLIPTTQVGRGWMLTYGVGVLVEPGAEVVQLLLDEATAFYADPYDIVVTPDGRRAFVSHAAADRISAIDVPALLAVARQARADSLDGYADHLGLSRRYVAGRVPTGANPMGLALSPDGRLLYVAERLEDRLAIIDTNLLETVGTIDLDGPGRVSTLRRGARLFHAARAFQGQFSCRSCHPDGDQDALAWDFGGDGLGRNVVNTMTLRAIGETSPFKWNGKNTSLYMQDGIRFAKFLTRVDPFPPEDLKALVAYMYSIPQSPNRYRTNGGTPTAAQQRGKLLFERAVASDGRPIPPEGRCITCHPPPYFTNRTKADVGTLSPLDSEMPFDTPQLVNIYASAPYLHDGRAASLEEIWTKNSTNDEHGFVSDLSKGQLNDLIEYLRSLGPPEHDDD